MQAARDLVAILEQNYPLRKMIYFPIELFVVASPLPVYSLPLIAEVRLQNGSFSEYPQQIRASTNQSATLYTRKLGYYAVHYQQPPKTPVRGAIAQMNDDDGAIAVFQGEPDRSENAIPETSATDRISPVYTLQGDGSLAVPTGLVFIRFVEGVDVASQRDAIKRAGYEIERTISYAPHAAWLRAQSGKISQALMGISQLESMPNVENVEPQMLMQRALR